MANTVVGIFEFENDAQKAQNYLLANGFADGDVDIKTATYKSETRAETEDHDLTDRIGNFFRDLFDGDEEETNRYSEAGRRGTIVTVHARDAEEGYTAASILDQFGAADVDGANSTGFSTASQAYTTSTPGSDITSVTDPILPVDPIIGSDDDFSGRNDFKSSNDLMPDADSKSLPVIEEDMQVSKREVETGTVRLRSRIIERPVQESVRLRQEQVTVNRTPVDRLASDAELDTFREGTIEMREYTEIPVVTKEARVVEEVSLNKTMEEHDEIINETLRSTEVDVENVTDEEKLRRSGLDL